jgi:hypothetical protein
LKQGSTQLHRKTVTLGCTVCVSDAELPVKSVTALQVAVSVLDPGGKAPVESAAPPTLRVTVPSVVAPTVKVTVPNACTPVNDVTGQ